jgi:hypothetical protein
MNGTSGVVRLAAAVAALGVNVALAGGLVSLARHYDAQAEAALATAPGAQTTALRCQPAPSRAG